MCCHSMPNPSAEFRQATRWAKSPRPHAQAYAAKGLTSLYPWQAAALEEGIDGSNLVYIAPTSGGKSLVAEVLMLQRLAQTCTYEKVPGRRGASEPVCLCLSLQNIRYSAQTQELGTVRYS